jgi:hypothetical protein
MNLRTIWNRICNPPLWVDCVIFIIVALFLLTMIFGCKSKAPEDRQIEPEKIEKPEPAPMASEGRTDREQSADAKLAEAEAALITAKVQVAELRAAVRREEMETRRIEALAQARWGRRLAWIVVVLGVLLTGVSFMLKIPKHWGLIGIGLGLGFKAAADTWMIVDAWSMQIGLLLIVGGFVSACWMIWRTGIIAKLFSHHTEEVLGMVDESTECVLKERMQAKQISAKVHGLAQAIRGKKPKPKVAA